MTIIKRVYYSWKNVLNRWSIPRATNTVMIKAAINQSLKSLCVNHIRGNINYLKIYIAHCVKKE